MPLPLNTPLVSGNLTSLLIDLGLESSSSRLYHHLPRYNGKSNDEEKREKKWQKETARETEKKREL